MGYCTKQGAYPQTSPQLSRRLELIRFATCHSRSLRTPSASIEALSETRARGAGRRRLEAI